MEIEIVKIGQSKLSNRNIWSIDTLIKKDVVNFTYSYLLDENNQAYASNLSYMYGVTPWDDKTEYLQLEEMMNNWLCGNEGVLKNLKAGLKIDLKSPPVTKSDLLKLDTTDNSKPAQNRKFFKEYMKDKKIVKLNTR